MALTAAKRGIDFLLKVKITAGVGSYLTVAGLRSTSFTVDNESVDVTNKDSGGIRQLLPSAGTTSLSISASGVFIDDNAGDDTHGILLAHLGMPTGGGTVGEDLAAGLDCELTFGGTETITGLFVITSLERTGEHNGEETFSISIENADTWVYTDA